jgi:hypothetical protein
MSQSLSQFSSCALRKGLQQAALAGVFLLLTVVLPGILDTQSAVAQRVRPDGVWQQVYDRLPNLPRENQYISQETGKAVPNNTLVSRLIRYHVYVKNRPTQYRLDWKLTLADYLNRNEPIEESTYPGRADLKKNPMEADIAAIEKLNRAERDALVQVLFESFNPQLARFSPAAPAQRSPDINSAPAKKEPGVLR